MINDVLRQFNDLSAHVITLEGNKTLLHLVCAIKLVTYVFPKCIIYLDAWDFWNARLQNRASLAISNPLYRFSGDLERPFQIFFHFWSNSLRELMDDMFSTNYLFRAQLETSIPSSAPSGFLILRKTNLSKCHLNFRWDYILYLWSSEAWDRMLVILFLFLWMSPQQNVSVSLHLNWVPHFKSHVITSQNFACCFLHLFSYPLWFWSYSLDHSTVSWYAFAPF